MIEIVMKFSAFYFDFFQWEIPLKIRLLYTELKLNMQLRSSFDFGHILFV